MFQSTTKWLWFAIQRHITYMSALSQLSCWASPWRHWALPLGWRDSLVVSVLDQRPRASCSLHPGCGLTQPSILSGSVNEYRLRLGSVTVGQLVHFVVSCFLNSRSGFLYTFCVYSPCSVKWNDCARRLDARVTIMWLARVSWSVVKNVVFRMLVERQWDYTVVSQQFAGIKERFTVWS